MSHRVLLEIPDDVYNLLEQTAEQTNQPLEQLAVDWLTSLSREVTDDPLAKHIGSIKTDIPDWGERHDELLGQALMDDHRSA